MCGGRNVLSSYYFPLVTLWLLVKRLLPATRLSLQGFRSEPQYGVHMLEHKIQDQQKDMKLSQPTSRRDDEGKINKSKAFVSKGENEQSRHQRLFEEKR